MRKAVMIAAVAVSLGLIGIPAFGDEDSDDLDDWYQDGCETMIWQFDNARVSREGLPGFSRALALRDRGFAQCDAGNYKDGAVTMRTALQAIGVYPLY